MRDSIEREFSPDKISADLDKRRSSSLGLSKELEIEENGTVKAGTLEKLIECLYDSQIEGANFYLSLTKKALITSLPFC